MTLHLRHWIKTGTLHQILPFGIKKLTKKRLLQNPSPQNGSAQPRPPDTGITVDYGMKGEPVVSRSGVLQEPRKADTDFKIDGPPRFK